MTGRRFIRSDMSSAYRSCRRASHCASSFYLSSSESSLSTVERVAYWRGRAGLDNIYGMATIAYACWAAGQDDRHDKKSQEASP